MHARRSSGSCPVFGPGQRVAVLFMSIDGDRLVDGIDAVGEMRWDEQTRDWADVIRRW